MAKDLKAFVGALLRHEQERADQGIPPLPLSEAQTEAVCEALLEEKLDPGLLPEDRGAASAWFLGLLDDRVPAGGYRATQVKADFLGALLRGEKKSPTIDRREAVEMLGHMGGGASIAHLLWALGQGGAFAAKAALLLGRTILVGPADFEKVVEMANGGKAEAQATLRAWAEAEWFKALPEVEPLQKRVVIRTAGEINTDFLSPAQEASTRDDIPLHALKILSTSPSDRDFIARRKRLADKGALVYVGDVVGTGSSRKSASNSLVWWIGDDIPHVPNKRRGGIVLASKIAPIFFNTLRGCGAIPVRAPTGDLHEGDEVAIDLQAGQVRDGQGKVLTRIKIEPASILDEARAGGRNNLIIGRKLTGDASAACARLGLPHKDPAIGPVPAPQHAAGTQYTLAQRLVGAAAGLDGVLPGEYVEPKASVVFSQDTTGVMTMQETQELACTKYATTVIQSFCHTPAGPKSKDARMQTDLGAFVAEHGGIDLRPGDGVIHTVGNRFVLPHHVGTGGDSHTRFPVGISFAAGSDLVAFAASQGFMPLDMPESVRVVLQGKLQPGITMRDLVNAIPWAAARAGKLNLGKGDAKVNVFADRILEIEGLEDVSVADAYRFTDASAERSAAAATFALNPERVRAHVANNLAFLKYVFAKRHPAARVKEVIAEHEAWLRKPVFPKADEGATWADTVIVNLDEVTEPLLAAPNDPDKVVTLSEVAGRSVDEVFIGSCMIDITDLRIAAAIVEGEWVQHRVKLWTVPPDRETMGRLSQEGVLATLLGAGANVHVPGCSLCMGNQAQVATGATTFSTSTRNFDNRMGAGAQVFLGSSLLGAVTARHGRLPTVEEYFDVYRKKVEPRLQQLLEPIAFA
ncbi:MAG: bifunctional aconitate hydratase 2/2-methylisocitrate dehydratase [Deltaproteobacteria bacterium]|nr:bifunctional aconitate hydratase 2/2-methylisocitrate dehydratase [Deltaproteobacteria bacterium]